MLSNPASYFRVRHHGYTGYINNQKKAVLGRKENQQVLSSPAFTSDQYCCHGARLFTRESAAPIVTENESLHNEKLVIWEFGAGLVFLHGRGEISVLYPRLYIPRFSPQLSFSSIYRSSKLGLYQHQGLWPPGTWLYTAFFFFFLSPTLVKTHTLFQYLFRYLPFSTISIYTH